MTSSLGEMMIVVLGERSSTFFGLLLHLYCFSQLWMHMPRCQQSTPTFPST